MKDKFRKMFLNALSFAFPFARYSMANKRVLERINRIDNDKASPSDFQYVGSTEDHKIEIIQSYFDKTIDSKKSLEEKSRAVLLSITVATSLIFGLLTIVLGQSFSTFNSGVRWFIVTLGSLSIIHMIVGAWLALRVISGKIQIYQLYPDDEKNISDAEKAKMLAVLTEQNANMNIMRGNNIYTCYLSTINSLVLLCILFISLSFSSIFKHGDTMNKVTDLGRVINQIKSIQSSLDSANINIESIKQASEAEKSQLIAIFSESLSKVEKMGKDLEELKKKNTENQAIIDKAKKNLKSTP